MPPFAFVQDETVSIQPSKILFWWIALSAASAAALGYTFLPLWYGLGIAMACAGFAYYAITRHALLKQPKSITAIRFGRSGLAVQQHNQEWRAGTDEPFAVGGFVSAVLMVIALIDKRTGARLTMILLRDSIDPRAARRLRVWLRWRRDEILETATE
jgi:hypothetical protein